MEAPLPQPQLGPTLSQQEDQEEEATSFFLASLAAATSTMTTTTSSNRSNMKASLSLLPASPDFMAFQGFVSLGVCASRTRGRKGRVEREGEDAGTYPHRTHT